MADEEELEQMRDASLEAVDLPRHPTIAFSTTPPRVCRFIVAPDVATVESPTSCWTCRRGHAVAAELGSRTRLRWPTTRSQGRTFSLIVPKAFHLLPDPGTALAELGACWLLGAVVILDAVVTTTDRPSTTARPRAGHRRHYRRRAETIVAAPVSRWPGSAAPSTSTTVQAAAVPPPKAALIRGRFKALPVEVQMGMDIAFSDKAVSFSYDVAGLRLERA
jgi:hypothetical protein